MDVRSNIEAAAIERIEEIRIECVTLLNGPPSVARKRRLYQLRLLRLKEERKLAHVKQLQLGF